MAIIRAKTSGMIMPLAIYNKVNKAKRPMTSKIDFA
jgi:hypothetical protein